MLQHALAWAARGFRVFPLHPGTKQPVWKGWIDHATTDPGVIESVWTERDYNVGVLTDDMIVVDVDIKSGKDGMMSAIELGLPFDTLTVRTPSGGLHLYYTGPNVSSTIGRLGEGLDVRSHHGFVLAPGSVYGGGRYDLAVDAVRAAFPDHLVEKCIVPRERAVPLVDVELDEPSAVEFARTWLDGHPAAVEGQGGDDHTYRTACKLRDFGLSSEIAYELMSEGWNDRCSPPWPLADLRTKVENAYAYATAAAGRESPVHQFGDVKVEPDAPRPARPWFLTGDDYAGAVSWLYEGVLPTTGVVILSAPSGAGKTFVALHLAQSLATGEPFFKIPPADQGGTLILVGEAFGSIKMRLGALGEAAGRVPIAATYVGGLAARGAWSALCDDIRAQAAWMQIVYGQPVRMIILDTLSASNILEREDDNGQAATVMKMFAELSQALGVLFLVVHHPPKSGLGERGAGAIRNNADYVLTITQRPGDSLREIEITKSRDGEQRPIGTFTLVPVGTTMAVSPGEPRIKPPKGIPPAEHIDLIGQAVDFALKTKGQNVQIEGYTWTDEESVFLQFRDGWKGTRRDRGILLGPFKKALDYAVRLGAFETMNFNDTMYYRERDILT